MPSPRSTSKSPPRSRRRSPSRSPRRRSSPQLRDPPTQRRRSRSPRQRGESPRDRHRSRSRSPLHRKPHSEARHRSPPRSRSPDRKPRTDRSRRYKDNSPDEWGAPQEKASEEPTKPKEQPNFQVSGALLKGMNSVNGIDLKFIEPPEAHLPTRQWRLYVFKGNELVDEPLRIHKKTAYLFGRNRLVADIPTDHPSCSSQHAVLQYREIELESEDGDTPKKAVRPYLMDLGSTNGTFINGDRIEDSRYYELREKDVLKFGNSSREYVLLHAESVGAK